MTPTALAEKLFDFAIAHPEGFTNADFMSAYGVALPDFNKATNKLRKILADDTITLVCDPSGLREKWTYRLVGTVEDGSPWVQNRLRDAESRFVTMASVASALVNSTDGRTADGRRARLIDKALRRLMEDLKEVAEEMAS